MAVWNRFRRRPQPTDSGIELGRLVSGDLLVVPRPCGDPLHALVSGTTGAGKTVTLRTWIGELAGMDDVALIGLDPKRTGLSPWSPRFTVVAKSVSECSTVLVRLWIEVERRLDVMDELRVSEWRPEYGGPFIVAIADELVQVASIDGSRVADVLSADALSVGLVEISDRNRAERPRRYARSWPGPRRPSKPKACSYRRWLGCAGRLGCRSSPPPNTP